MTTLPPPPSLPPPPEPPEPLDRAALFSPVQRWRWPREFRDIVVHPTQELPIPSADSYRGGPDWPHFDSQILARHCWGAWPTAVDLRPHPGEAEFPYFDRERYLNPRYRQRRQRWRPPLLAATAEKKRPPERWLAEVECGIWCGPVVEHFGHAIADFGMRIAVSARLPDADARTPLVFGVWPLPDAAPPVFFWDILDHLGVARDRIMLIGQPTRFGRLRVVPQAERSYGAGVNRRHLRFMDAITAASAPAPDERGEETVFVSRSRMQRANFAGESYLDEVMAAAGVRVFHPETADLHSQLRLYRRARRLIFSEGSALQALQLLGHLDADILVLPRRPGDTLHNIAALRPLRARARSLRCLSTLHGIVCGLTESGEPQPARGVSVLDQARLLGGFAETGLDLARLWDARAYLRRRDADIAGWIERRLAAEAHPDERAYIEQRLRALSLRVDV